MVHNSTYTKGAIGLLVLIVALAIIGAGAYYLKNGNETKNQIPEENSLMETGSDTKTENTTTENLEMPEQKEVVISYGSGGYTPKELQIEKGIMVVFRNESGLTMWPASAIHPTHAVYPNSDIKKCGGPEEKNMFDACRGIAPNGSYSFIFNEVGTWKYHDHLKPSNTGTIVVK